MPRKLFDFLDQRGRNLIKLWLTEQQPGVQARVKAKLQTIIVADDELPPNLITPTTEKHIQEIRVNVPQGAYRLFVCRGPKDWQTEITLLSGAREKNSKYVDNTPANAEKQRQEMIQDVDARRCEHEFFGNFLGRSGK